MSATASSRVRGGLFCGTSADGRRDEELPCASWAWEPQAGPTGATARRWLPSWCGARLVHAPPLKGHKSRGNTRAPGSAPFARLQTSTRPSQLRTRHACSGATHRVHIWPAQLLDHSSAACMPPLALPPIACACLLSRSARLRLPAGLSREAVDEFVLEVRLLCPLGAPCMLCTAPAPLQRLPTCSALRSAGACMQLY